MTRVLLIALALMTSAVFAQNMVWTGRAIDYKDTPAELWIGLDGFNDLETAVKAGTIQANGRFSFELPPSLPDEALSLPDVTDDCGDVTPGLRLGTVASVIVKDASGVRGQMVHTNRRFVDFGAAIESGDLKLTAWFYANRAGFIKEDCLLEDGRQVSDVRFQKGWNVLTIYFTKRGGKRYSTIRNGYTQGLQRWFFMPQTPDPEQP